MSEEKDTFNYSYSAKEQEEIRKIREKYVASQEEESKLEQLRRLDGSVIRKASTAALSVGIISSIVMGTGMSLVMTDLGEKLGLPSPMLIGILVGVLGLAGAALAYPLYNRVVRKERERIAPEILRLTDELS